MGHAEGFGTSEVVGYDMAMGQKYRVPKKNGLVKGKIDQNLWSQKVFCLTHSHISLNARCCWTCDDKQSEKNGLQDRGFLKNTSAKTRESDSIEVKWRSKAKEVETMREYVRNRDEKDVTEVEGPKHLH